MDHCEECGQPETEVYLYDTICEDCLDDQIDKDFHDAGIY